MHVCRMYLYRKGREAEQRCWSGGSRESEWLERVVSAKDARQSTPNPSEKYPSYPLSVYAV